MEKIKIHGFKSFAKSTVLKFSTKQDSNFCITAIVGPNGSGKSNIIDAVKWVLGEQSYKSLRGKVSSDIIFSGSNTKGQMGLAEVSLFFNNSDKSAPVDYSEIIITRRLFRNGESEYILNGNKVRLQDILLLMAKCNVGHKSYSVISQGMIDSIINTNPFERKAFFDEATGVKELQIKKQQAIHKLKRTNENLQQSKQLLDVLKPQHKFLKEQVEKLEKRQVLEKELLNLQSIYYTKILHNINLQADEIFKKKEKLEKEKSVFINNLKVIQEKLSELEKQESRTQVFNRIQQKYNDLISEKNNLLNQIFILKEKQKSKGNGTQDLSWLLSRKQDLRSNLNNNLNKKEILDKQIHNFEKEIYTKTEKLKEIDSLIHKFESKINIESQSSSKVRSIDLLLKQGFPGVLGIVADLGIVEEKFLRSLEITAGKYLQAIVVENEDVADNCLEFLKQNRLGTAIFLPLNKIKPKNSQDISLLCKNVKGVYGYAVDLIDFDMKFFNIFSFVFGSTLIVDDFNIVKNIGIGNFRMVTLEGDLFEKTGVIKGGFNTFVPYKTFKIKDLVHKSSSDIYKQYSNFLNKKDELENQVTQLKIELEVKKKEKIFIEDVIKNLENQLESVEQELNVLKSKSDSNINNQIKILQKNISELDKKISQQKKLLDDFNNKETVKQKQIFSLQKESFSLQNDLDEINNEIEEYNIELAKLEIRKNSIIDEMKNEFGENYQKFLLDLNSISSANTKKLYNKINTIKSQLNTIGEVEEEVLQEFDEINEKFLFLKEQIDDLSKALIDTKKLIKRLDKVIKENFNKGINKINKTFNKFFKILFNGGKAELKLIKQEISNNNGNEIEETRAKLGIDIVIHPKNKKIKNLSILSGGEKSLVAIALICAIIYNNKPPFVFFDEIDAALDQTNSLKLSKILKSLAKFTQFIIITHNRSIINSADLLYGISMNVDGISQVIGLKLSDIENFTAKENIFLI